MGAIFALLGALYYWMGKITGLTAISTSHLWSKVHLWLFSISINLIFLPMHFIGLAGMPRRIGDYPDGYGDLNRIMGLGSISGSISVALFLVVLIKIFSELRWNFSRFGGGSCGAIWTRILSGHLSFHEQGQYFMV
jgi:cytochrome c oxidase subunit I